MFDVRCLTEEGSDYNVVLLPLQPLPPVAGGGGGVLLRALAVSRPCISQLCTIFEHSQPTKIQPTASLNSSYHLKVVSCLCARIS